MANEQNLVPQNKRTKSEQRKIASMGGKKSGEVRRMKADFKAVLIERLEQGDTMQQLVDSAIEKAHEERYRKLLANVAGKLVFSRDGDCIWQCRNCGHLHIGKEAPEVCPVCNHPQSYFQLKPENY